MVLQAGGGTIDTNASLRHRHQGRHRRYRRPDQDRRRHPDPHRASTFTGTTTVTAGTLQLSGGGTLGGDLDAQSGTTFTGDPTGTTAGTVAGAVTVRAGRPS